MDPGNNLHNKAVFSTSRKTQLLSEENFQGNGPIQEPNDNYSNIFPLIK